MCLRDSKHIHSWDAYNLIRLLLLVFSKVFVWYFSVTFTFRSRYTSNYIYSTLSLYPYFSLLFQHHTPNKGYTQCSGVFCFNSTQKYRVNACDIPRAPLPSPLKPKTCPQTVNVDYQNIKQKPTYSNNNLILYSTKELVCP